MATRKKKARFDTFEGFPKPLFGFLRKLKKNNEREWFQAHKADYERHVKAPLAAFVEDAEPELGRGKSFRIHRDVRFSADKSPYETNASAVFERAGCVYYVHLEPTHFFTATGCYQMAKDQRQRFYDAVMDGRKGKRLVAIVEEMEGAGYEIGGEALKRAARGYPPDHERARFLRHKGLTASMTWKPIPAWLHMAEAGPRLMETFRDARSLNAWLEKHVGPSEETRHRFVKD
ncbi:MAG: DUF2461 domain-containing protein [Myxococcota bacterium]